MRKAIAWILGLLLLTACCTSFGEDTFIMEGYDGDNSYHDWQNNYFFKRMQEKTGIGFTFRQVDNFEKWQMRKKEIIAAKDLPDVLFKAELTPAETVRLYQEGTIIDLKPYIDKYAPNLSALLKAHPDWEKAITLPDGAIAALPSLNTLQNNNLMWINKTWLDRLHLQVPTTVEELTEVLREFKKGDPNRNGRADEIPLTFIGMWDLRWLAHAFGILADDYNLSVDDYGHVSSPLKTDAYRAFVTWLHDLWTEGLLDQEGFSRTDALRQITNANDTIPFGLMLSPTPLFVVPASANDQYVLMLPLKHDGKQVYRDLTGDVIRGTFAITSACKEPEKLIKWVDYLYSEEGSRLAQSGKEGSEYIWNQDGLWEWVEDMTTVASYVLPEFTIVEGGSTPGLYTADFQLKYADDTARKAVEQMNAAKPYASFVGTLCYMSPEDEKRMQEIQDELGRYAEKTMAAFVTGDQPINDETWKDFCDTLDQKGLQEMISIRQKYVPVTD